MAVEELSSAERRSPPAIRYLSADGHERQRRRSTRLPPVQEQQEQQVVRPQSFSTEAHRKLQHIARELCTRSMHVMPRMWCNACNSSFHFDRSGSCQKRAQHEASQHRVQSVEITTGVCTCIRHAWMPVDACLRPPSTTPPISDGVQLPWHTCDDRDVSVELVDLRCPARLGTMALLQTEQSENALEESVADGSLQSCPASCSKSKRKGKKVTRQ